MIQCRSYSEAAARLRTVGLRPTRQRVALARALFGHGNRHLTAESLHGEVCGAGVQVSLATVYNTLHQFTAAGLLRELVVEPGKIYFDTNISDHHHFYFQSTGRLQDIPGNALKVAGLPEPPEGTIVSRVDVVVRIRNN